MRQYKRYSEKFKNECKKLRREGYSLDDIVKIKKVSKTTIYEWIKNIKLSAAAQKRFWKTYIAKLIELNRAGKIGVKRRIIKNKPQRWSTDLIRIVAHFLFDGQIRRYSCIYSSRNKSQIREMQSLMKKNFNLMPSVRIKPDGVTEIRYFYADLADYIKGKGENLLENILSMSKYKKKVFLQAFFDDEGCIDYKQKTNIRRVRGYQHSEKILKLVQSLLKEFGINGNVDKRFTEIAITNRKNLLKFQKHVNFSPNIFINPKRKNGVWKIKIDKKTILEKAIQSYQSSL